MPNRRYYNIDSVRMQSMEQLLQACFDAIELNVLKPRQVVPNRVPEVAV